jgi:hypothetical protein
MIFFFDFFATATTAASIKPATHYAEWIRVFFHFIFYFPRWKSFPILSTQTHRHPTRRVTSVQWHSKRFSYIILMGRARPFSSQLLVPVFFMRLKEWMTYLFSQKIKKKSGKTGRSEVLKSNKIERKFL